MATLISIVVPLYNHAQFIGETLRSLIGQTYCELELIVIDDGSTDGSVAAVEAMRDACEARFRRFVLHTQPNAGVSATLNRGIGLATGEFIFLLASDDIAKPLAIETFLARMQSDDAIALVCGDVDLIDQAGHPTTLNRNGVAYFSFIQFLTVHRPEIDLSRNFGSYETLIGGNYLTVGILLRRRCVLEVGGYDETCAIEDLDLWLKLARRYRFDFVQESLALYRQHSANTVVRLSERIFFDELNLMMRELDECVARGIVARWRERVIQIITASRLAATVNREALQALAVSQPAAPTDEPAGLEWASNSKERVLPPDDLTTDPQPEMSLRYTPADELPPLAAEQLRQGPSGVWMESPGRVRRYFRYAPEFIDDPAGTGIFAGLGTDIYRSPPVFVSAVDDTLLVGYRTVVSAGSFQNDEILVHGPSAVDRFLDGIAEPDDFANEQTGLRRTGSGFVLNRRGRRERHIPGTSVVLSSHEPSNYGSLLFRVIPKLLTLQRVGLTDVPVIVGAHTARYRQLLHLFGVEPGQLIPHDTEVVTRLDRAIIPSLRNQHAFLDHESHGFMQSLADRFDKPTHGRRIYVSRLRHGKVSGTTRIMLNEPELIAELPKLNFEIIEPEQLSLEEQIATFASADMVVGPSGSAMFNTVFCRPGTKIVDIESEPNWIYAHSGLFASCSLRYGLVVGQPDPADTAPVHRRWTVDVDHLMQRLQTFIHA